MGPPQLVNSGSINPELTLLFKVNDFKWVVLFTTYSGKITTWMFTTGWRFGPKVSVESGGNKNTALTLCGTPWCPHSGSNPGAAPKVNSRKDGWNSALHVSRDV